LRGFQIWSVIGRLIKMKPKSLALKLFFFCLVWSDLSLLSNADNTAYCTAINMFQQEGQVLDFVDSTPLNGKHLIVIPSIVNFWNKF
jgi:hypothetical protein